MNEDSFKHLESLFHELNDLPIQDRADRLNELDAIDPSKADALRSLLSAATIHPEFLNAERIHKKFPAMIEIAIDGSTVLADRYTILELIGIGGSSTVFCAQATNPDRKVAIKMLRFGLHSERARDRFDEESKSLAKLTHPHIAHIYETGIYTQDDICVPWIAMELIPHSRTIIEYIKANSPSEEQRIELFRQVCHAIQAAHELGVLHLDLNASNILIDSHGYPKIIDFGLAGLEYSTASPHNNKAERHIGTRYSMAPEQTIYDTIPFDERTDIYALGLLFTEMLTGHRLQAFHGLDDKSARKQIAIGKAREQLASIKSMSEQLSSLIDSMLRVDPSDRLSSVAEILNHFDAPHAVKNSRYTFKPIASIVLLTTLVVVLILSYQPSQESPASNEISLPSDIAIQIANQNPRTNKFSPNQASIIKGLSIALETDNHLDIKESAELHAQLADNSRVSGSYELAIVHYQKAIDLLDQAKLKGDRNWMILSLTDLLLFLGKAEIAKQTLIQVDRTHQASPLFLLDLGIAETQIHLLLNQHDKANNQLQYTMSFLQQLAPEQTENRIDRMRIMSDIYINIGLKNEAINLLIQAKALTTTQTIDQGPAAALIDIAIANAQFDRNKPSSIQLAETTIQKAIVMFEDSNDLFHAQWARRQLGAMHLAIGNAREAVRLFTHAESQLTIILGENHHETLVCRAYRELGSISLEADSQSHLQAFNNTLHLLINILGTEHPIVSSLRDIQLQITTSLEFQSP